MPRLPVPGKDDGTWGDILNEYLAQTHKIDGTLKDDSVGPSQIQNNAITAAAIAPDAITATEIQDGSIQEAQLASSVQTKLNAVAGTPEWATITGKPAVIASGATQADARAAIGAGTSNLALGTSSSTAKAGNYQPASTDISDSTSVGRSLLTAASATAARTAIGAGTGSGDVTLAGAQTLTNKTINGSNNTLTNIGISSLSTTGTASGSTFLRGDGAWATPAGGGGGSLPSQTGHAGATLITDGSSASWHQSGMIDITAPPYNAVGDGWSNPSSPTDNAAAIQAALDDANGRMVYIPPGVFAVGSSLVMNPGQAIAGCSHIGSAATSGTGPADPSHVSALSALPNMNAPIILGPNGVGYVTIRDLFIDGVKAVNPDTYGIYIADGSVGQEAQWVIERVTVNNCGKNGIHIGNRRRNVHGYRANATGSGGHGLYIGASDAAFSESIFSGSQLDGVHIYNGTQTRLYACDIFGNVGSGIRLGDFQNHIFIHQTSIDRNHKHGVHLGPNTWNVNITACLFASNSRESNAAYHHIYSESVAVGGATITGNGFTYASEHPQKPGYVIYMEEEAGSVYEFGNLMQSLSSPTVSGWTNAPLQVVKGNTVVCTEAEYATVTTPIPGVVYVVTE